MIAVTTTATPNCNVKTAACSCSVGLSRCWMRGRCQAEVRERADEGDQECHNGESAEILGHHMRAMIAIPTSVNTRMTAVRRIGCMTAVRPLRPMATTSVSGSARRSTDATTAIIRGSASPSHSLPRRWRPQTMIRAHAARPRLNRRVPERRSSARRLARRSGFESQSWMRLTPSRMDPSCGGRYERMARLVPTVAAVTTWPRSGASTLTSKSSRTLVNYRAGELSAGDAPRRPLVTGSQVGIVKDVSAISEGLYRAFE